MPNHFSPTKPESKTQITIPELETQIYKPTNQAQNQNHSQAQNNAYFNKNNSPILAQAQNQNNKAQEHQPKPNQANKKPSYANVINPANILNPNASIPSKSFVDAVAGVTTPIPPKPVSFVRGEPAIHFTTVEIQSMVEPFKLSLVGKFSFGRPPMDLIRNFFCFFRIERKLSDIFIG